MTFNALSLHAHLVKAVTDAGYTKPTPIQEKVIPVILEGRDVMAAAQTGTGKTASFTLPILQRLSSKAPAGSRKPRCLVLTPTRELAAQVHDSVRKYGKHVPLRSAIIFGGIKIGPQIQHLRAGVDIVIATPGRLLDHIGGKTIDLSGIEILVLDEADRMLDMGFIRDIRKIMNLLPKERNTLLFSATFNPEIRELAATFLNSPVSVEVSPPNVTAKTVAQVVHPVGKRQKKDLLVQILRRDAADQTLVFTRSKHGADRLARQLAREGFAATAIHGGKQQNAREKALGGFKGGTFQILVATDIAARGLDISELSRVVNFDLPQVPEDYVHRIGRTGRAGNSGNAISFVSHPERKLLSDIQRFIGSNIPYQVIEGFDLDPLDDAEPAVKNQHTMKSHGSQSPQPRRTTGTAPKQHDASSLSPHHSPRSSPSKHNRVSPSRTPAQPRHKPAAEKGPADKGAHRRFVISSPSIRRVSSDSK